MEPEISESQFALGANRAFESARWRYPLISPARIPTQREEKYGGFDMESEIDTGASIEPLFIQYKRSEYMIGNARYHQHFPGNYYRFKIKNARQHNILTRIAEHHTHTYYLAPLFHTFKEYCECHERGTLLDRSIFATARGLPAMDNSDHSDRHTMAFTEDQTVFFSEPTETEAHIGAEQVLLEIAEDETAFNEVQELQTSLMQLAASLSEEPDIQIDIPELGENTTEWLTQVQLSFERLGIGLGYVIDTTMTESTHPNHV